MAQAAPPSSEYPLTCQQHRAPLPPTEQEALSTEHQSCGKHLRKPPPPNRMYFNPAMQYTAEDAAQPRGERLQQRLLRRCIPAVPLAEGLAPTTKSTLYTGKPRPPPERLRQPPTLHASETHRVPVEQRKAATTIAPTAHSNEPPFSPSSAISPVLHRLAESSAEKVMQCTRA